MSSPLLRPKMLAFHLLCAATVIAMINLSLWQFDRLNQRQDFNARVEERSTQAAVDVTAVDLSNPADIEWRRIGAVGEYRPEDEVLILNRSQGGRAGLNVVTPMQLNDGSLILVVRGFLPLNQPVPAAPSGTVTVIGTARLSDAARATDLSSPDGRIQEFFRLDIERIDSQIDGDLVPVALYVQASDPPDDVTISPVASPTLSEGSHFSYAIQWLIFAVAVAVGWVLATRRTLKTHSRVKPSA
jgi:surfeit locus 1 family protein